MAEVIAVGAVDNRDVKWDYSCFGDSLDVVAPSGWDGDPYGSMSMLSNVWAADQMEELGWNPYVTGYIPEETDDIDYTAVMGGTSAACPQVAAIAALVMARGHEEIPTCNASPTIREIITRSAIDIGNPGFDPETGHGRANAYRALLSVIRGDVDNDGDIDSADQAVLIDMVFFGGNATLDDRTGDLDCDGDVDSLDLGVMIDHVFLGGPQPGICFAF